MSILGDRFLPPQGALDLVAQRLPGVARRGDLRLAGKREGELDGVTGSRALDGDVRASVGKQPRPRAVPVKRPLRRSRREAQRDRVLAAARKVELLALESSGI